MNKCKICKKETKNKIYCSLKCRDISRKKNSTEDRKCLTCKKTFTVYKKSKQIFCCLSCGAKNNDMIKKRAKKFKETSLLRYKTEHPMQNKKIQNKLKHVNLEKYGVEYNWQRDDIKKKIKQTNLKKYNVEYPQQSTKIKEKTRQTVEQKYGGFTLASKILVKKVRKTMIDKYGVDNPQKNNNIKQKTKNTNLRKYATEYGLACDEIIKKREKTLIDKYGVKNVSQIKSVIQKRNEKTKKQFYNSLLKNNRLKKMVIPLFNIDDYNGFEKNYPFMCTKCKIELPRPEGRGFLG